MALEIKEVVTKKEYKTFIYLPEKIHKGHESWLPPIYFDEKKFFNPNKNLSFRGCDYKMLLAYKDGEAVGRIMGIINNQHNQVTGLKNARFGYFECYNDPEVSHALISEIEKWGREKGMTKIVGPFGFTDRDIQGVLIEGFEYEPVVDSATNYEFLPKLIEKEGFTKELDCVIYRFPLTTELPPIYQKVYERVTSKKDIQFREYTSKKLLNEPLILAVLRMVNESFKDIYGFMPMDDKEMLDLAKRYLPILDPRFVKIVTKGDEVIAFLVSMPNLYKGIQKSKGRLLPFGIFHILKAMKTAKSVNTMLGAVAPAFQKQGLDIFLSMTTIASAKKAGMTSIDTHVVMEDNNDMMAEMKRYGAFLLKKFRVYQKPL
ncbi:MAG TPA: hypothetical protein VIH57_17505 [Bacteroidales bacterium]